MSVILIIPKKADQHCGSTSMVFSRMNDRIKSAKEIIHGTREISEDIFELQTQNAKLQKELKTAKADGVKAFVSDTTETGQFSWSDCQWLDDWVNEWLEQKELIPPTQED